MNISNINIQKKYKLLLFFCFIAGTMLIFVCTKGSVISFSCQRYKDTIRVYGMSLTAIQRILLGIVATASVLPYIYAYFRDRTFLNNSWVKLGLVFSVCLTIISVVSPPEDLYKTGIQEMLHFLGIRESDVTPAIIGQAIREREILSFREQNRLILTTPLSIFVPFALCVTMCILTETSWNKIARVIFAVTILFVAMVYSCDFRVGLFPRYSQFVALLLITISAFSAALGRQTKPDSAGEKGKADRDGARMIKIGAQVLMVYSCVMLSFMFIYIPGFNSFLENRDTFEKVAGMLTLLYLLQTLIIRHKYGVGESVHYLKAMPLFVFIILGLCVKKITTNVHSGKILWDMFGHEVDNAGSYCSSYFNFGESVWFLPCVACVIYTMYYLYDYGMKKYAGLFLLVTAAVIALICFPSWELIPGSRITSSSIANMLIGLISPAMIIAAGIVGKRKKLEKTV